MSAIDDVYTLVQDGVKRPDLQAIIWRRIHRSILNYHHMDMWGRDLEEQIYIFATPNTAVPAQQVVTGSNALFMNNFGAQYPTINVQIIKLSDLIKFKYVKYIRKWMTVDQYGLAIIDPTTGRQGTVQGGDLIEKGADSMFDGYGYDKTDCWYKSGDSIRVGTSTPLSQVAIGYYKNPYVNLACNDLLTFQKYDSWIVDKYPDLLVSDVKARIFTDIGKTEEATTITKQGGELQQEIMRLQTNEVRAGTR